MRCPFGRDLQFSCWEKIYCYQLIAWVLAPHREKLNHPHCWGSNLYKVQVSILDRNCKEPAETLQGLRNQFRLFTLQRTTSNSTITSLFFALQVLWLMPQQLIHFIALFYHNFIHTLHQHRYFYHCFFIFLFFFFLFYKKRFSPHFQTLPHTNTSLMCSPYNQCTLITWIFLQMQWSSQKTTMCARNILLLTILPCCNFLTAVGLHLFIETAFEIRCPLLLYIPFSLFVFINSQFKLCFMMLQ